MKGSYISQLMDQLRQLDPGSFIEILDRPRSRVPSNAVNRLNNSGIGTFRCARRDAEVMKIERLTGEPKVLSPQKRAEAAVMGVLNLAPVVFISEPGTTVRAVLDALRAEHLLCRALLTPKDSP